MIIIIYWNILYMLIVTPIDFMMITIEILIEIMKIDGCPMILKNQKNMKWDIFFNHWNGFHGIICQWSINPIWLSLRSWRIIEIWMNQLGSSIILVNDQLRIIDHWNNGNPRCLRNCVMDPLVIRKVNGINIKIGQIESQHVELN